ncbi:hypothetical protein GF314_04715 [bacterium]|nr:hypothetical protein [bacterium]
MRSPRRWSCAGACTGSSTTSDRALGRRRSPLGGSVPVSRREVLGLVLVAAVILLGRWLRHRLLLGDDGGWRDPAWLASFLPPEPEPRAPRRRAPRRPSAPLDPNTCPADSLVLLPGIGPTIAGRMVAARARGVHFACARDLQAVRGIGPKLSAQIDPYLVYPQRDAD